ncbi:hypothetical protein O3P69_012517 [Scylla paramamosain]|uniref:C2H2-type domain-containing protein n=1 Tax=Scylla paramamosain TaxID=85552 RepID=A0AAW0SER3_SCYPA
MLATALLVILTVTVLWMKKREEGKEEEEEEEEEYENTGNIDYSDLKEKCLRVLTTACMAANGVRKKTLQRKIEEVMKAQTPAEVESTYLGKTENLKKKVSSLEDEMKDQLATNKAFWAIVVKSLPGTEKKVLTRIRELKSESGCKILSCPMPYCIAEVKNMPRHLAQVHGVVGSIEQQTVLRKIKKGSPQQRKISVKKTKYLKRCSMCDKVLTRVDSHLATKHGLKRGSARFREMFNAGLKHLANERSIFSHSQPPSQSRALRRPASLATLHPSISPHVVSRVLFFFAFTMDLLSDNSSSSSEHEAETSTKPRKRQRCPEKWIRAEIKHKCNRGEAYTSHTSKKEVGPRRVGPPCTCPDKCFTKAPNRKYLPPGSTLISLYKAYKNDLEEKQLHDSVVHDHMFRDILNNEFNIGTTPPQADTCNL